MKQWRTAWFVVLAMCAMAVPAVAQVSTGRNEVTVVDTTGAVLPGATVALNGPQKVTTTTGAAGAARFLHLPPGVYTIKAALQGFGEYRNTSVPVAAGGNVQLKASLGVAGMKQEVQVTAQTPVIDAKRSGTSTNVTLDELQNIPSARDPWVVMQSVPGIIMDRVNVGGSESGQQPGFMGKGADSGQATWNVDGMPITDMSSLSSPFYYDFDMFQEMSVATGGSDAKSATGGIQLNFMLKSGGNAFHGTGKGYFENESMQSKNLPSDLAFLAGETGKGDRTEQFGDWGGELGGPILKDRWSFWIAYGSQDIRILKLAGAHDRTLLKNLSFKTQGQITKAMRGSFTFFQANKQKYGRNAGSTRPQETTWDQDGPNKMYKGEVNYVFGNNLFLVGRYASVKGGFTFMPEGGMSTPPWRDSNDVWLISQPLAARVHVGLAPGEPELELVGATEVVAIHDERLLRPVGDVVV